MRIDADNRNGGVSIEGDRDELGQLRDTIDEAIERGEAGGLLLADEGPVSLAIKADDG